MSVGSHFSLVLLTKIAHLFQSLAFMGKLNKLLPHFGVTKACYYTAIQHANLPHLLCMLHDKRQS